MNKKLIIGISAGVLVIIGMILAVVFIPKNNAPVVNEEVKEEMQEEAQGEVPENKEVEKVSMSNEEKYDYILKANNKKNLDECLIEEMDVDFDGVNEFVYYPNKIKEYAGEIKIYGGDDFKELTKEGQNIVLDKIELLEDDKTKERKCVVYSKLASGVCWHIYKVSEIIKNGEEIIINDLFINQCDDEQEAIVNANVVSDEERKCVEEYLVNGKKVGEDEYNKEMSKFEEKYKVIKKFEVQYEL